MLETAQPLATLAQAKLGAAKLEADVPLMQKYASEGLLGLDPIALAHQLCLIDLGMLKEIRSVFFFPVPLLCKHATKTFAPPLAQSPRADAH